MNSLHELPQKFKDQGKTPPLILSTLDLIDMMAAHHQDEALALVELAQWHQEQAEALASERRALAADVTEVLRQAERVLA